MEKLTVTENGIRRDVDFAAGSTLLEALTRAGIRIGAPCGGGGRCGKCRVRPMPAPQPTETEKALLSANELERGVRLACCTAAQAGMEVQIEAEAGARVMTERSGRAVEIAPLAKLITFSLEPAPGADGQEVLDRFIRRVGVRLSPAQQHSLPGLLGTAGFCGWASVCGEELLGVYAGEAAPELLGMAVDIGTTTLAAYLVRLSDGTQLGVASALSAQRPFGADVISRCAAAALPGGLEALRSAVCTQIDALADELCAKTGRCADDIALVSFAGNTVMLHLLAGVSPAGIAQAPFTPAFTRLDPLPATALGLSLKNALALPLPCVSGYVGADTVAAALSCGIAEREGLSLLLDIGTNGEIVLGGRERLLCCSAAAGPAFEGAHIDCGMGGADGAISRVAIYGGKAAVEVIGGGPARGVCGSGLVDAVAGLLLCGAVEPSGYMEAERFTLCGEVYISRADIRQVQLAKSAIASGIAVLLAEAGASVGDIDRVYLAGGFGSCLSGASACAIGLIPPELEGRIERVGNAAGDGAVRALLSRKEWERCGAIASRMEYVELSARADFSELFMDNMAFGAEE